MPHLDDPLACDRLTELVIHLSGAESAIARSAVAAAMQRHGEWGDGLLNVADALVGMRRPESGDREGVGAGA